MTLWVSSYVIIMLTCLYCWCHFKWVSCVSIEVTSLVHFGFCSEWVGYCAVAGDLSLNCCWHFSCSFYFCDLFSSLLSVLSKLLCCNCGDLHLDQHWLFEVSFVLIEVTTMVYYCVSYCVTNAVTCLSVGKVYPSTVIVCWGAQGFALFVLHTPPVSHWCSMICLSVCLLAFPSVHHSYLSVCTSTIAGLSCSHLLSKTQFVPQPYKSRIIFICLPPSPRPHPSLHYAFHHFIMQ